MTGSRKMIEVLNRYGYIPSYNTIEEIETELTFEASKDQTMTPAGIDKDPNLGTGFAWDNYDRFVETLTGKNTLHDTVGICYQTKLSECEPSTSSTGDFTRTTKQTPCLALNVLSGQKRRRTYEAHFLDVEPYRKKPKLSNAVFLPLDDKKWKYIPESYKKAKEKDTMWMLDIFANNGNEIPMWVGWNALLYQKWTDREMHKIVYLPQINESLTSHSVVAESISGMSKRVNCKNCISNSK